MADKKSQKRKKKSIIKSKPTRDKKNILKQGKSVQAKRHHLVTKKKEKEETEEERKIRLKKLLLAKRKEILKEIKEDISKYIKGESKQLVDTALDDGDWSIVDLSEDINLKHMNTHREDLQKVDEALRKLEEGTYGICEDCGEEISEQRLKILPYAIYCIDCKEKREKIEEMEKKEGLL